MLYIYPYKLGSKSARALREGLSRRLGYRVKLVRPNGRFSPRRTDSVINWGNSTTPIWELNDLKDLNQPVNVRVAANKLDAFSLLELSDVPIPEYTDKIEVARTWFDKKGTIVVCRTILNGHSGAGIVLADSVDSLVEAPLYVKYKKKKAEYRVHIVNKRVIDIQEKRKREGFKDNEAKNTFIRNHHTGWVYCRTDLPDTDVLCNVALEAVKALYLQIGAVDIIYNEKEDKYYVLEVNTAPGLEGTTLTKYVEAFVNV